MSFEALERRITRVRARVGCVIADSDGAALFERRADERFPAASVIKLPLVIALHAEAAAGRVDLAERVPLGAVVEGSGVLRHLRDVRELTLRDHATLALIVSDNTATNRLIDRVGADVVNAYLDAWGCPRTRLRRRMFDVAAQRAGLENEMTPRETARLLGMLARGELVDRATSDALLEILALSEEPRRLGRFLPEGAWVAHKTGTLEHVRNDVGVLRAERTVLAAFFADDVEDRAAMDDVIGLAGWSAYRAAGGAGEELPAALALV